MMSTTKLSYTIYYKVGFGDQISDGVVSILVPPLPNCSYTEVVDLAKQFLQIANEMIHYPEKEHDTCSKKNELQNN
jgi:hypothetical protein